MSAQRLVFAVAVGTGLVVAAWGVWNAAEGGVTVAVLALIVIGVLAGIFAFLVRPGRSAWASRIVGLAGAACSWLLALLAWAIRSLCWGDPDIVAREACVTRWVVTSGVLAVIGALSLAMGFRPVRRSR